MSWNTVGNIFLIFIIAVFALFVYWIRQENKRQKTIQKILLTIHENVGIEEFIKAIVSEEKSFFDLEKMVEDASSDPNFYFPTDTKSRKQFVECVKYILFIIGYNTPTINDLGFSVYPVFADTKEKVSYHMERLGPRIRKQKRQLDASLLKKKKKRKIRIFLSSTFHDMKEERQALVKEFAKHQDVFTWLPPNFQNHPFEFYKDITDAIGDSNFVILIIGSHPGTAYEFIDVDRFRDIDLRQLSEEDIDMADAVRMGLVEDALLKSGESHTQVEAQYFIRSKPIYIKTFIRKDWYEKLQERIDYWESKGFTFNEKHLHSAYSMDGIGCSSGKCWDAPSPFKGKCRLHYYSEIQQESWKKDSIIPPNDSYRKLSHKDWQEISWINFTLDVMRISQFNASIYNSCDEIIKESKDILSQIREEKKISLP